MAKRISFEGIGARAATFKAHADIAFDRNAPFGSPHAGKAVSMSGNGEVNLTPTGEKVFGKLIGVESDNFCTVQYSGFAEFPTDGTAIVYDGTGVVGGATPGSVKSGESEQVAVHSVEANKVYAMLR